MEFHLSQMKLCCIFVEIFVSSFRSETYAHRESEREEENEWKGNKPSEKKIAQAGNK